MRQSRERTGAQEKVGKILCALANEGHGESNGRRKNPLETIKGEKNMKVCPKCGSQMNDTDLFCQNCGMSFGGGAPSFIANILWIILLGWENAVYCAAMGVVCCCTIIGIPLGLQYFKFAKLAFMPFGSEVVDC